MTNPITREKCLELAGSADPNNYIESLVRASVALGMEMAAKECEGIHSQHSINYNTAVSECVGRIRKLAEEVQRG